MRSTPEDRDDCWSSESEALFRAARFDNAPSAADRERVRRVLAQRLADPHGAKVARHWRAKSFRLLQLGVGVTFVVAAGLAVKHSQLSRTFRPAPAAVQRVAAPVLRNDPQPVAADVFDPGLLAPYPLPPVEAVSSRNEMLSVRSSAARPASAPSVSRPSRSLPTRGSAEVAASASDNARVGRSSAQGPAPAAIPSSPGAESVRAAAQSQQAAAPTQPSVTRTTTRFASKAVRDDTDRNSAKAAARAALSQTSADARAELVFMSKIQAAMVAAAPAQVLALCAEHERRWVRGTFVQEREGLRAMALCKSAAKDSSEQARQFLDRYPRTTIAPRVREACKLPLKAAK